jgi:hypothetical protein
MAIGPVAKTKSALTDARGQQSLAQSPMTLRVPPETKVTFQHFAPSGNW